MPRALRFAWIPLILLATTACNGRSGATPYQAPGRAITVDGQTDDWAGVPAYRVSGLDHCWWGLPREAMQGDDDCSYTWRAAWQGNRIFFLVEVRDQTVLEPEEQHSYHNDSVEIFVAPGPTVGPRTEPGGIIHGYELHFQGFAENQAFCTRYDQAQMQLFLDTFAGEMSLQRHEGGYRLEVGFTTPRLELTPGSTVGLWFAINDDDGADKGRETQMILEPTTIHFWSHLEPWARLAIVP
jgi:hypothetical protein